ncbi:hypothetical protein TPA4_77 [Tsukamurella phage TPA4]|uniref:endonuclease VII n=1 Tax=Tsukamurella phage TPA4 TaxID=1647476 RepID=UPI0007B643D3|nr:endonuclease VII [Tsukamurella phage TPA4]AKJ72242.1 hypothetical protein TPA4_77 [Tsukamurella phage TPA4]
MTTKPTPSSTPPVACKDCRATGITTARPLAKRADGGLQPGPRCATHHRAKRKATNANARDSRIRKTYGLEPHEYDELLAFQDGMCAVCRKARAHTGGRLGVDHDHATGAVRGLLCAPCNEIVIGRYDADALARAIAYLADPPAPRALGRTVTVPTHQEKP